MAQTPLPPRVQLPAAKPQSLATLQRLRALGDDATCLLGNHDLHLLAVAHGVRKPRKDDTLDDIRWIKAHGLAGVLLTHVHDTTPGRIVLDAQTHLVPWYTSLGYESTGDEFLEDGIAHVPMARRGR